VKCVVPISGGLDSSVILNIAKYDWIPERHNDIYCISFDYGQRHIKELKCAVQQANAIGCKDHTIIDLKFFKDIANISSLTNSDIDVAKTRDVLGDPQTVNYVPFRNMMMLSIACAYAESVGASDVFHGSAQVDSQAGYWDGSVEFVKQINKVTALNRRDRITIQAPLIDKSKQEIVEIGVKHSLNFAKTHTCYEGKEVACGECTACSSRLKGFVDAGYIDPLPYAKDIDWKSYGCKSIEY
jgi:7-cyano-7-deazaguanine synthase